jgi:hypothetical protein
MNIVIALINSEFLAGCFSCDKISVQSNIGVKKSEFLIFPPNSFSCSINSKSCRCALTEHHAMKAYWGMEV